VFPRSCKARTEGRPGAGRPRVGEQGSDNVEGRIAGSSRVTEEEGNDVPQQRRQGGQP
jgi:hypothetical protein